MISRKAWIIIVSLAALVGLAAGLIAAADNSRPPNQLQISTFAPKSANPAVQDIHCDGSTTTDRVMGPAKQQFDSACKLVAKNKDLVWGDQGCGERAGNNKNAIIRVTGRVDGKSVSGTYQVGPCAQAAQAWFKMSAIWEQGTPNRGGGVAVKALVLPPEGQFKEPGTWPEREAWFKQARSSKMVPQCVQSLPNLDLQICTLPKISSQEEQLTVRLTAEQLYALIKANPEKVLQILGQAKQVPPPPGFPGYVPPQG